MLRKIRRAAGNNSVTLGFFPFVFPEVVRVFQIGLDVYRLCMPCGKDYLVDHHICVFVFDPDICQGPVILVGPAGIVFEINCLSVLQ